MGVAEDLGVERFFVPEMVIDRGDVRPGPAADLADGGLAETGGRKDLAGGFQQLAPGFIVPIGRDRVVSGSSHVSNK